MNGLSVTQAIDADLASVVASVRGSLVHVRNGRHGAGAGTVWHPEGLVVTNAHVVGRGPVRVELPDGRLLPGHILTMDRRRDLAALRVEAAGLPTIALGDSRRLRAGQWVIAVGDPWGVAGAATAGVVIGMGEDWPEMPATGRDWIAMSLHLRPGHSGGPLVDVLGRLVGINTLVNGPDIGVAIPAHIIVDFLRETLGRK